MSQELGVEVQRGAAKVHQDQGGRHIRHNHNDYYYNYNYYNYVDGKDFAAQELRLHDGIILPHHNSLLPDKSVHLLPTRHH